MFTVSRLQKLPVSSYIILSIAVSNKPYPYKLKMDSENISVSNETEYLPWLYDIDPGDTNWIITSSFMIFTMQTGFGMLESGCVSVKNEVNIMMKNVADIVLGGFTYWAFGFSLSFGRSSWTNPFIAFGDYFVDPYITDPMKGAIYSAFIFQMSFATTSTTIVSGAMAERCNFKAYCLFSLLNTVVYCIPAGWVWGEQGFLKKLGVVDIAGSGPVHLVGGSSAFASAIMLGPRFGRYDNGIDPLPLGSPVNAVMGLFVLWWGWLAFNSGSTYGLSGSKWEYAARAAVMTIISSFGGGCFSLAYSMMKHDGRLDVLDIINGVLAALVAITAGCFLYTGWEAFLIGVIGAALSCITMPLIDKLGVDDPVGATSVHGIGGIWGVIAVGLFAQNPVPLDTTSNRKGLLRGGGLYLLGVQCLMCVCLLLWSVAVTVLLLWFINKIIKIRLDVAHELIGADLTEHYLRHGQAGVSRAISAFRPHLDTTEIEKITPMGLNPAHDSQIQALKILIAKRKTPRYSKILKYITRNRNFGINLPKSLIPKGKQKVSNKISHNANNFKVGEMVKKKTSSAKIGTPTNPPTFAWTE